MSSPPESETESPSSSSPNDDTPSTRPLIVPSREPPPLPPRRSRPRRILRAELRKRLWDARRRKQPPPLPPRVGLLGGPGADADADEVKNEEVVVVVEGEGEATEEETTTATTAAITSIPGVVVAPQPPVLPMKPERLLEELLRGLGLDDDDERDEDEDESDGSEEQDGEENQQHQEGREDGEEEGRRRRLQQQQQQQKKKRRQQRVESDLAKLSSQHGRVLTAAELLSQGLKEVESEVVSREKKNAITSSSSSSSRKSVRENFAAVFSAEEKKLKIVEEFRATEKAYLRNLYILKRMFLEPLKKHEFFTEDQYQKYFGEFQIILPINEMFCMEIFAAGDDRHAFLEAVFRLSHCFKLYSSYVNSYDRTSDFVRSQRESNDLFAYFLGRREKRLRRHKNVRMCAFDDYLVLPIQRIPRYKLLLDQLVKEHQKILAGFVGGEEEEGEGQEEEEQEEEDRLVRVLLVEEGRKLKETLTQIDAICHYINQKRQVTRLDSHIPVLAKKINIEGLMQPHRHLIKMKEWSAGNVARCAMNEPKPLMVSSLYLFNDIFVVVLKKGLLRGHKTIAFSLGHGVTVSKEPGPLEVSSLLRKRTYEGILLIRSEAREDLQLYVAFETKRLSEEWIRAITEQIDIIVGGTAVIETELRARGGRSTGPEQQSDEEEEEGERRGSRDEMMEEREEEEEDEQQKQQQHNRTEEPQVFDAKRIPRPGGLRQHRRSTRGSKQRRKKKKKGGIFRSHQSAQSEEYEFAQRKSMRKFSLEDALEGI